MRDPPNEHGGADADVIGGDPEGRWTRPPRWATVLLLVAAGGVALGLHVAHGEDGRERPGPVAPSARPTNILYIASARGAIVADGPVLDSAEGTLALGRRSVWVTDWKAGNLVRVAKSNGAVTGRLRVVGPRAGPFSVAYGGGSVWVAVFAKGEVWRVDPATLEVTARIPIGSGVTVSRVAYGQGRVWVSYCCRHRTARGVEALARIDPATGRVDGRARLPGEGLSPPLAVGPEGVWGAGGVWEPGGERATVVRVDPATMRTVRRVRVTSQLANPPVAVGGGMVWVAAGDGRLLGIDPGTGRVTLRTPSGTFLEPVRAIAATRRAVYVVTQSQLIELDPRTLRIVSGGLILTGEALAVDDSGLWTIGAGGKVLRLDPRMLPQHGCPPFPRGRPVGVPLSRQGGGCGSARRRADHSKP